MRNFALWIKGSAVFILIGAAGCSQRGPGPCPECNTGTGGVSFSIPLTVPDVLRVTATVSAADISPPIIQDLTISGAPPVISGTILNIPSGGNRTVALAAFPASPDAAVAIDRGSAT